MDKTKGKSVASMILSVNDGKNITGAVTVRTADNTFSLPCIFCEMEGFEEFKFAVHKAVRWDNDWTVTECGSGLVVRHGDDMDDALHFASLQLRKVGVEGLKQAISKAAAAIDKQIAELHQ